MQPPSQEARLGLPVAEAFPEKTVPQAAGSTVVAHVTLDRNLYDYGTVVNGAISFRVPPAGQTEIEWIDSLGRVAWRSAFPSASEY